MIHTLKHYASPLLPQVKDIIIDLEKLERAESVVLYHRSQLLVESDRSIQ